MKLGKEVKYDLKAYYVKTGLSRQVVAESLGVATTTLWRMEKAGKVPKVYLWALVAIKERLSK